MVTVGLRALDPKPYTLNPLQPMSFLGPRPLPFQAGQGLGFKV